MNRQNTAYQISESTALGPQADLCLEMYHPLQKQPLTLPVKIVSLSAKGVILEGLDLPDDFPLDAVVGQESIIQVPAHGIWQGTDIHGKILWLRPGEGGLKTFQAALELQETDPQARRMLENQLITYPKDMKELWDHWDQVHTAAPGHSKGDQSVYFVGMGAVAAGLMLHYSGPESINPLGIIIAIYGSLVMAGKSLWSMWGRRTVGSRQ